MMIGWLLNVVAWNKSHTVCVNDQLQFFLVIKNIIRTNWIGNNESFLSRVFVKNEWLNMIYFILDKVLNSLIMGNEEYNAWLTWGHVLPCKLFF